MEDNNSSPQPPPPPQTTHPELSYTTIPLNTPATEIRLLELFPSAEFPSPLHCRLYNTPISSPAPFKALSYAWGSDDKTHLIYIDSNNNTSDNGNDADADASLANLTSGVSVSSGDEVDGGGTGARAAGAGRGEGEEAHAKMTPTKRLCIIRITSSLDTCLRHL
ncbi:hypothetical protein B0H65DRAFT_460441 [Neurospora tetraspora]|uniref:Heterokaryon incompatibility domain-containing protein n=1 Tax=Neurospora tetraspora TaxID=94610 RepID=A0AAE0MSA6_9PEZI|nr:hypothetical protein B0H65DRAFT_460441 [Neurospora tetraspora]